MLKASVVKRSITRALIRFISMSMNLSGFRDTWMIMKKQARASVSFETRVDTSIGGRSMTWRLGWMVVEQMWYRLWW